MCFKLEAKTKREITVKCVGGGALFTPSFSVTKDINAVFYFAVKIMISLLMAYIHILLFVYIRMAFI
jgi:hypothetical protein